MEHKLELKNISKAFSGVQALTKSVLRQRVGKLLLFWGKTEPVRARCENYEWCVYSG